VNDYVPSCGYLQPVATDNFPQAPPDPISHNRAAEGFLDAEAEAAVGQLIGTKKRNKVGTRTPFSGAVNGVKLSPANKPRLSRKTILSGCGFIWCHGSPGSIRG